MIPPSSKIINNNHSDTSYQYRSSRRHRYHNLLGLNAVGVSGGGGRGNEKRHNEKHNDTIKSNSGMLMNQIQKMKYNFDASDATKAFGPIAIIGGTVSIYTAALTHSSTTLTPLSVVYLLLLALNYSIMPRISKKYVSPKTNKESVALVEEVVKMSMGVGGFLLSECMYPSSAAVGAGGATAAATATATTLGGMGGKTILNTCVHNVQNAMSNWSIQSSLLAAGLPSALYAIQGVLTYTSYQNLDSVTFNGITQIKTLTAALCCYLVLGKVQSRVQIIALALLSLSTLIFQGIFDTKKDKGEQRQNSSSSDGEAVTVDGKKRFVLGILPCLAATFLSGLAGAFSQRSLQTIVGSMERNAYFYSAEISFFSALCLLISMGTKKLTKLSTSSMKESNVVQKGIPKKETGGYFDHWTWQTFVPIIVKATGGILTALVHKHSGSVMKGFALVLGLVFSALLQTILDGKDLTFGQMFGTAFVLLSSWLHFTNPST